MKSNVFSVDIYVVPEHVVDCNSDAQRVIAAAILTGLIRTSEVNYLRRISDQLSDETRLKIIELAGKVHKGRVIVHSDEPSIIDG